MREAHEWAAKEEEKAKKMLREATWRMPKPTHQESIWDRPENRCGESKAEQAAREKMEEKKKIQATRETYPTKESEAETDKEIEQTKGNMKEMIELKRRGQSEEEKDAKRQKQAEEQQGAAEWDPYLGEDEPEIKKHYGVSIEMMGRWKKYQNEVTEKQNGPSTS